MRYSYDIVGDIAIVEIPEEKGSDPESVARDIKKSHPRIKTVLQKIGGREGEFRLRKMKKITGTETETVHKEHGFRFRLDPTRVFFSPREATEREKIAGMVKPGETVMVMFSGVGPYGIVIAGKQPGVKKVYQVEINPRGFEYMKQNISMNKLSHLVVPIMGDVKDACRPYFSRCDRVLTPLARDAYKYLDVAIACLKKGGIIHFYCLGRHAKGMENEEAEAEMFRDSLSQLKDAAGKAGRPVRILSKRKVLPYSPGGWKLCIDAEVL